ncbi:MAG: dephospho-CoA kinase [Bacteroidetes bacterium]|nr:dephospho-CoA kinase [Bacteroidota bacterium]
MRVIGITGGIGSGKSTVCAILSAMGYPVYNSDNRAAVLMQESPLIQSKIRELFGESVFSAEGKPDRAKIGSLVFNDAVELNKLNSIIHPAVGSDFYDWLAKQNSSLVFKESAIIFEHNLQENLDAVWLVYAPEKMRIARVMKRGLSKDEIKARMSKQIAPEIAIDKSDSIIINDELEALIPQLIKLTQSFNS